MNTTIEADIISPAEAKQTLILSGDGYQLTISPEFIKLRDDIIEELNQLGEITNPQEDAKADALIKRAGQIRIITEKSRKEVVAPAVAFQKDTNSKAAAFMDALGPLEESAKKLRGNYAAAVLAERNRIIRELEEKRQAEEKAKREAEAKEAARIEAERIAQEAAEKARREAEEAAFNAVSPEEEAAAKAAAAEAQRKAEEAAKAEAARVAAAQAEAARIAALPIAAPVFVPEAPKGVRMQVNYRVTDIDALYRWNAGLVTLTERRKDILDAIARGKIGAVYPDIPGLEIFEEPYVR